jgi:hypothetical protein
MITAIVLVHAAVDRIPETAEACWDHPRTREGGEVSKILDIAR